ncbi:MAG: hypothetical protein JWM56_502 [Candidatus Peribacteria bacterium]|nr:hypothetical protein [Candidatus Peribacteria bacterium]
MSTPDDLRKPPETAEEIMRKYGVPLPAPQKVDVPQIQTSKTGKIIPTVFPGTDTTLLKNYNDPSGFVSAGFSSQAILGICERVRDTYMDMMSQAPKDLVSVAPNHIPLYCDPTMGAEASLWLRDTFPTLDTDTMQGKKPYVPASFIPSKLAGFALSYNPHSLAARPQEVTRKMRHECLHLLTLKGMHKYMRGPLETFTLRLEAEYCGGPDIKHFPFIPQPDLFQSSTGFISAQGSAIEYSPQLEQALYLSATFAAKNISSENIWKIWSSLTDITNQAAMYPVFSDVRKTIVDILGEQGEALLNTMPFKPMELGTHHFMFPGSKKGMNTDTTEVKAVHIESNPHFGFIRNGTWQESALHTKDIKSEVRVDLLEAKKPINAKPLTMPIDGHGLITKEAIINSLTKHPSGKEILSRLSDIKISAGKALVVFKI